MIFKCKVQTSDIIYKDFSLTTHYQLQIGNEIYKDFYSQYYCQLQSGDRIYKIPTTKRYNDFLLTILLSITKRR